jgi:hypothetical protein
VNELEESKLLVSNLVPDISYRAGWVNSNLYQPTAESFGIVPIPSDICIATNMDRFDIGLQNSKQRHAYLAQKQGTRCAVLPVHTNAEFKLFSGFMRDPTFFISNDVPKWSVIAKAWNRKANEDSSSLNSIFYKVFPLLNNSGFSPSKVINVQLVEHLENYYTKWRRNANTKLSVLAASDEISSLSASLRKPQRANLLVPPVQQRERPSTVVPTKGLLPVGQPLGSRATSSISMDALIGIQASTDSRNSGMSVTDSNPTAGTSSSHGTASTTRGPPVNALELLGKKRALDANTQGVSGDVGPNKQRKPKKPRTCMRCQKQECKGRGDRSLCSGTCPDCHNPKCKGRNSKKPNLTCVEARKWENNND